MHFRTGIRLHPVHVTMKNIFCLFNVIFVAVIKSELGLNMLLVSIVLFHLHLQAMQRESIRQIDYRSKGSDLRGDKGLICMDREERKNECC